MGRLAVGPGQKKREGKRTGPTAIDGLAQVAKKQRKGWAWSGSSPREEGGMERKRERKGKEFKSKFEFRNSRRSFDLELGT